MSGQIHPAQQQPETEPQNGRPGYEFYGWGLECVSRCGRGNVCHRMLLRLKRIRTGRTQSSSQPVVRPWRNCVIFFIMASPAVLFFTYPLTTMPCGRAPTSCLLIECVPSDEMVGSSTVLVSENVLRLDMFESISVSNSIFRNEVRLEIVLSDLGVSR